MKERLEVLSEIFETELTPDDLDRETGEALEWDSFHIMEFLVKTEARFHKRVTIEQIAEVRFVRDLVQLMESE